MKVNVQENQEKYAKNQAYGKTNKNQESPAEIMTCKRFH